MNKSCCFTGHRPDKLYGYDLRDKRYSVLAKRLKEELTNLIENEGVDTFISGGALGVDTVAFLTVHKLKEEYPHIRNILAAPFLKQDNNWFKQEDKLRYAKMKRIADISINVDKIDDYKVKGVPEDIYHPAKMQKRNEYMVDNSDFVIAVWNGDKKGGTYNCVRYAEKVDKNILIIDPNDYN